MPTLASPVPSTLGVLIAVHELGGQPDAGLRPLLVSHATGFHGRCYLPMAHELADRFHSIGFDYRGHGDTPRPEGPVVWDRYGDDALAMGRAMRDVFDGPVDAFGHSMGGACLLMAAHAEPGLFRRLVVFEPIVFPPAGIRPDNQESPLVAGARRRRPPSRASTPRSRTTPRSDRSAVSPARHSRPTCATASARPPTARCT